MHRNVHIITDSNDKKLVLINDICFKGKNAKTGKKLRIISKDIWENFTK